MLLPWKAASLSLFLWSVASLWLVQETAASATGLRGHDEDHHYQEGGDSSPGLVAAADNDPTTTTRNLQCDQYFCPADSTANNNCPQSFGDCTCNSGFYRNFGVCKISTGCNYQCPANSSRKPNQYCYSHFGTCQCDPGYRLVNGNSCVIIPGFVPPTDVPSKGPTPLPTPQPSWEPTTQTVTFAPTPPPTFASACAQTKKNVRITEFCINGDASSAFDEHLIWMNNLPYFPNPGTAEDCTQNPPGYCTFAANQCHSLLPRAAVLEQDAGTLTVGNLESDAAPGNVFAIMSSNDWFNPTCNTYSIKVAVEFDNTGMTYCWDVSNSADMNPGMTPCSAWAAPNNSYQWTIQVTSIASADAGFTALRLASSPNHCMQVVNSDTTNGVPIIIGPCTAAANQLWQIDSAGNFRSRINTNKCLDISGPGNAIATPLVISDCVTNDIAQRFIWPDSGEVVRSIFAPNRCLDSVFADKAVILWDCTTPWL